jgi:hypothetical protein
MGRYESSRRQWQSDRAPIPVSLRSYGFEGKRIELVGSISFLLSFKCLQNARTKFITFDVVDMHYSYNAIFGRGLLNTFEAMLHLALSQGASPLRSKISPQQPEGGTKYRARLGT